MQTKVTLAELAREAECSESQASRAIAGKPNVAPVLRARVLEAARRLNYRNLSSNHPPRIAFLTSHYYGIFATMTLRALEEEGERLKLPYVCIDRNNLRLINEYFHDGVIAINYNDEMARDWARLSSLPLVIINGYGLGLENICSIDPDSHDGNRQVLQHLARLGHRRIARVCGVEVKRSERGRLRGSREFLEAAAELKLPEAEDVIFSIDTPLDEVIPPLLDRGITAIFMIHQALAVPVAACIRRTGRRIPEDVSLVTYEVGEISEFLDPPHTTLEFDYRAIARRAFVELLLRIRGEEGSPAGAIPIPNILHVRESTAPRRLPDLSGGSHEG